MKDSQPVSNFVRSLQVESVKNFLMYVALKDVPITDSKHGFLNYSC